MSQVALIFHDDDDDGGDVFHDDDGGDDVRVRDHGHIYLMAKFKLIN